jgi:hypothetical protein
MHPVLSSCQRCCTTRHYCMPMPACAQSHLLDRIHAPKYDVQVRLQCRIVRLQRCHLLLRCQLLLPLSLLLLLLPHNVLKYRPAHRQG